MPARSMRPCPTSIGGACRREPSAAGSTRRAGVSRASHSGPVDGPRVVLIPGATGLEGGLRAHAAVVRRSGIPGRVVRPRRPVRVGRRRSVEPRPAAHPLRRTALPRRPAGLPRRRRRPRPRSRVQLRGHARRARPARTPRPLREPHAAQRPARARSGVPQHQANRPDQLGHHTAAGGGAHALGHPQQPEQGAPRSSGVRS